MIQALSQALLSIVNAAWFTPLALVSAVLLLGVCLLKEVLRTTFYPARHPGERGLNFALLSLLGLFGLLAFIRLAAYLI